MLDGIRSKLTARLVLAAATGLMLAGYMGAGRAEPVTEQIVAFTGPAVLEGAARFQPSAEASREEGLGPLANDPAALGSAGSAIESADRAAAILPPSPAARSLGTGVASYYGRAFSGRLTASGERFDPDLLTAAHRTLPFGSLVRVTNPRNGRSTVVRINDRGPFTRGRLIDLSDRAAEQIGIIGAGHGAVELDLLAD